MHNDPGSDYINANYIPVSPAPSPTTHAAYWLPILTESVCVCPGLQALQGVHRHPGATAGNTQRLLEDGAAAEEPHHRHADAVQRAPQGELACLMTS